MISSILARAASAPRQRKSLKNLVAKKIVTLMAIELLYSYVLDRSLVMLIFRILFMLNLQAACLSADARRMDPALRSPMGSLAVSGGFLMAYAIVVPWFLFSSLYHIGYSFLPSWMKAGGFFLIYVPSKNVHNVPLQFFVDSLIALLGVLYVYTMSKKKEDFDNSQDSLSTTSTSQQDSTEDPDQPSELQEESSDLLIESEDETLSSLA